MFAVIRIRGCAGVKKTIEDTMEMLNLDAVNNCVVIPENDVNKGMIEKVKDYVTYGEISKETYEKMLFKWGRINGDKKVTPEYLAEKKATVNDLFEAKVRNKEAGIKVPFRLHPPAKGYKSVKRPFTMKGDLGYRGDKINDLLNRMI